MKKKNGIKKVSLVNFLNILYIVEALPGVLGNRGKRVFISGEQGNKGRRTVTVVVGYPI